MRKRKYLRYDELDYMKKFWIKERQGNYTWLYQIIKRHGARIEVKEYNDGKFQVVSNYEYPDKSHCKQNGATLEILSENEFLVEIL